MSEPEKTEELDSEPGYDPDDDCKCLESGVEPEWEWDKAQGCWICSGCGEIC